MRQANDNAEVVVLLLESSNCMVGIRNWLFCWLFFLICSSLYKKKIYLVKQKWNIVEFLFLEKGRISLVAVITILLPQGRGGDDFIFLFKVKRDEGRDAR